MKMQKSMSNELHVLEQVFLDYLLTGDPAHLAPHVAVKGSASVDTKLDIYSNAYKMRFREAIETNHEILGLYLGDELFDLMVQGYVKQYPSRYTSLRDYTAHLPVFLSNSQPFSEYPIVAELAGFERLLLDVFDAPDAEPVTIDALLKIPAEDWPITKLRLHPSTQLFTAHWNSVESWQALKAEENPDAASPQPNSHWLLWRGWERLSEFRSITAEEFELMQAITHGGDFAHMCELLTQWHSEDEAPVEFIQFLTTLISQGMVISFNE
jgi:hypothetical protein